MHRQRGLLLAILSIGCAIAVSGSEDAPAQLQRLAWLEGQWSRIGLPEGQAGYEHWRIVDAAGALSGTGARLRDGVVVFEEKLRIVQDGDTVFYTAELPGNPEPVRFRLTKLTATGFAFENPDHDFPKRIAYERDGDRLEARISAGDKGVTFHFQRVH